ncbi:MAG: methylase involved in ubiquinone/menaquinone biosynthesis [Caulobacteraceae bacterium]|nr:methylase involved in ubiquinone/menaquinone biosynthesis [Caulobacteraceae bacterium]
MTQSAHFDSSEGLLGGFSSLDGTMEFFTRVNVLLEPHFTVLDLGAGRGAWHTEDQIPWRRALRDIKGKVHRYIGCDVDPVVMTNPITDENLLIEAGRVPMASASVDLIICDYVLEHVADPKAFRDEIDRLLKPGGYFCARTPHSLNYVSLAARVVANSRHVALLSKVQPDRKPQDVFPTVYRCNTRGQLRAMFQGYDDHSYVYVSEPSYYFGKRWAFRILSVFHKLLPGPLVGNLFVFVRKPV